MKKFLALLISLSMLLVCVPGVSLVASAATIDDATFLTLTKEDFQTKNGTATNAGKESNPYLITDVDEFRAVFDNRSSLFVDGNYVKGYFEIPDDTDIALVYESGAGYIPHLKSFNGGLEGNGNTISVSLGTSENRITFGSSYKYVAIIGAGMGAKIKNLNSTGTIYTTGGSSSYSAGGIIGSVSSSSVIENCVNDVVINHTSGNDTGIGGIVGNAKASTVKNCINNADFTALSTRSGGIVGSTSSGAVVTIESCKNYGSGPLTGGIVGGLLTSVTITKCANYGQITSNPGSGIAGVMYNAGPNTITIEECINAGQITKGAAFVGKAMYAGSSGTRTAIINITNSYNIGNTNGQGDYGPGSFIGHGNAAGSAKPTTYTVSISDTYSIGKRQNGESISDAQELVLADNRGTAVSGQTADFTGIEKDSIYVLGNNRLSLATGATGAFLKTIPTGWDTDVWELPSAGYPYIQLKNNKIDTTKVTSIVEDTTAAYVTKGANFSATADAADAVTLATVKDASGAVTPIAEGTKYAIVTARFATMPGDYEYGVCIGDKHFKAVRKGAGNAFAVLVYDIDAGEYEYKTYVKIGGEYTYGAAGTITIAE